MIQLAMDSDEGKFHFSSLAARFSPSSTMPQEQREYGDAR